MILLLDSEIIIIRMLVDKRIRHIHGSRSQKRKKGWLKDDGGKVSRDFDAWSLADSLPPLPMKPVTVILLHKTREKKTLALPTKHFYTGENSAQGSVRSGLTWSSLLRWSVKENSRTALTFSQREREKGEKEKGKYFTAFLNWSSGEEEDFGRVGGRALAALSFSRATLQIKERKW